MNLTIKDISKLTPEEKDYFYLKVAEWKQEVSGKEAVRQALRNTQKWIEKNNVNK